MIIRIEDAPSIKNIKIDINFDENGTPVTSQKIQTSYTENTKTPAVEEVPLNLDENFEINKEIVKKPEIPDLDREVKVSSEMINEEY